jgi:hypothetical protein
MQTHETVASFRPVEIGSNRKFGVVFAGFFFLVAVFPLIHHHAPRWWALPVAVVFLALAFAAPRWLAPINRAWFQLGLALNKVVSPIVMALLFFGAIVPVGLFLRRKNEDLLSLKWAPEADSYWIPREPPGPASGSMTKQF